MDTRAPFRRISRRARCASLLALWTLGLIGGAAWARVDSALDPERWLRLEGEHFEVYTNADLDAGVQTLEDLERFRALFAALAPALDLSTPAPLRILAFDGPRSYQPYKFRRESGGATLLGQFVHHPDVDYLLLDAAGAEWVRRLAEAEGGADLGRHDTGLPPIDWLDEPADDVDGPPQSYSVAFHELTHFIVRNNFPGAPLWLQEGLAEYYGTFALGDEVAVVGRPIPRHVRFLRADDGPFGLANLLAARPGQVGHGPRQIGRTYALSWLLVHHLLSGDGRRLERAADYLLLLDEGVDPVEAFEQGFGVAVDELEAELRHGLQLGEFPAASLPLSRLTVSPPRVTRAAPADVLTVLGDYTMVFQSFDLAEHHFLEALAHDPHHGAAHAGLATLRSLTGRRAEADLLFRDAARFGAVDPLSLLRFGRHQLGMTTWDPMDGEPMVDARHARQLLGRAVEAHRGYFAALVLSAQANLAPEGDADVALRAAVAAGTRRPDQLAPLALEIVARAELGHEDQALALLEGPFTDRAPANEIERLAEEVEVRTLLRTSRLAAEEGDLERAVEALDLAVSATSDPRRRESLALQLETMQSALASDAPAR